ncbi:retrovirus-related Pol polyprotein from transposon TNT 1-94 [Trichonephila clavipes]|nr:retrovirus-related Pol polyprotein from transposon TNT 1-94 [Trichonephila clavipes]
MSLEFQSTVQQIYRWKEEDFRVVKIEAELILEANRLQLMKQDLEKAENAYLSSFTLKKSKTLPGATAAAHGDPNDNNDYQKKSGKDMDNFLTELGIKHEVTNSYTPEMNGVAERFNLTALDGIKTLLKSSEVPHKFWGEALLCFTYAWNRICHKDSNKTPFEKYSGRKPSVLHLKPFGCLAYAGVPKQIRKKKFDMRAKMGIMMGYAQSTKGYRIWLIDENKLVETINSKDSLTSRLVSKTSTETPSTSEKPDVSSDNHSLIPCTEVKWIRNIDLSEQQALMVEVTIPNCYKQAIRSRDASKWHDAMDREINVMKERKVWDLVDHPDNIKILENRWVYTIKYDENNKIVRYKARLVARGNTQLRDSDFATNRDDRVSMGGFITFIDENPISSRIFKQKSVSLSTMEAEYENNAKNASLAGSSSEEFVDHDDNIELLPWPACSLDLSIIQNVWFMLAQQLGRDTPPAVTPDQLWQYVDAA